MYKIESGIPLPDSRTGNWKALALTMKIGDSVLLDKASEVASLRQAMVALKYKAKSAKQYPSGIRVWRSE